MASASARTGHASPPAGGGQVPGLGEAFQVNLNTGQGVYSYQLPLPEGVAGHQPRLALEYAHGNEHDTFGFGWRMELRRVTHRLDYGVGGGDGVEIFADTGKEIMPVADGTYRALRESAFTRYSRIGGGWKIEERNGVVHELGADPAARVADPAHPERVTEWLLQRTTTPSGNVIEYDHDVDEGVAYVTEIRYAAYAVRFVYEARPDARLNGRAGYLRRRAWRCARIELVLDPGPRERSIRSWIFDYGVDPSTGISLLASIEIISRGTAPDGSEDVRRPAVRFDYTPVDPQRYEVRLMTAEGADPPPLDDPDVALVTLDDAPLPGILQVINGRHHYWRNRGDGTWACPRPISRTPRLSSLESEGVAFIDVDASGTADLVAAGAEERLPGYYENGGRDGWRRFVAYPRARRTRPAWTSRRTRLTDADGNGRVDAIMSTHRGFAVWINEGPAGWSEPSLAPKGTGDERPDLSFDDPLVHLADITGDGLDDLVRVRSGRVEYWPCLGRGHFGPRRVMANSPRLPDLHRLPGNLVLMDVSGCGCADLVFVSAAGIRVSLNRNGESFADARTFDVLPTPLPGTIRAVDLFGRGAAGLLYNSRGSRSTRCVTVTFGAQQPAHLLTRVDHGTGLVSEIRYRTATQEYVDDRSAGELWETNFPFPLLVVGGTKETDAVSGQSAETRYRYHEAHYEPRTRQFQGFRRAERIELGDESRADTVTRFHYLMAQERVAGNGPEYAALNGMQQRTEVLARDGSPLAGLAFTSEEADYGLTVLDELADGRQRVFVYVAAHRGRDTERTDDVRVEERTYDYDDRGNVVRERLRGSGTRGGVAQPTRTRVTETTYANNAARWMIDRPSRMTVRDETGAIVRETRRYYDGAAFVGLPLGDVDRGLMTREEQLVLPEAAFEAHYAGMDTATLGYHGGVDADGSPGMFVDAKRHAFDARGLKLADRDPLGNEDRYEYEPSGLYRTKLIDALGETVFEYDRATGQPLVTTYADGSVRRLTYDAQGRILAVALPGEPAGQPARVLSYDDAAVPASRTTRFHHGSTAGATSRSVTYFDGRGSELQERIEAEGGRWVVSNLAIKNPWGDTKVELEPSYDDTSEFALPDTAGRPRRRFFYDARGRPSRTVDYNGGVSTASYLPFEIVTADANDNDNSPEDHARGQFDTPRREELDVLHDRVRTVEAAASASELTTTFRVGVMGELLEVADGNGTLASYTYDFLGNRLQIDHREVGERRTYYNARGEAVRSLDARGNDVRAEIDARGRLRRLVNNGSVAEEYRYDDLAQNALGRLAEVTYEGGAQVFRYDQAGRLLEHEHHFDGHTAPHTVTYEHDGLGREIARSHPDGTRVERRLTANGWVKAIPGVLDAVEYDPRGLPVRATYANGVSTEMTYEPGVGRVASRKTTSPGGQVFADVTYEYDLLGILLASNDVAPGSAGRRSYAYDPLYQVSVFTSTENGSPRARTNTYTGHYNLSRFDEADLEMHYDDPLHPDRVAGLTPDGGARSNATYDANGNLTDLTGRRFRYDFKDLVERFEDGKGLTADYRYDHRAMRVSKRVDDGHGATVETLFVGDLAEIRDGQAAYFVRLGHMRVAILSGGATRFVHCDYLGSTACFSDAAAAKISAIAYRPFGNLASASGPTDFRTYGIHPFDAESGLYYMKRRYYSPELGRFLTPDPLAIYQPSRYLSKPKALHPYVFCGNDPVNKVDLDGYSFWSVVGAVVGAIAGAAAAVAAVVLTGGIAGVILGLALAIGLVTVGYVVASATTGTEFGKFMRGFLVGVNAGFNAVIATTLFGSSVGVTLGVINFLAAVDTVAHSAVYQGILGWSSWLMPMSWLVTTIGLLVFFLNFIGVSAQDTFRVSVDWGTGTIVTEGGSLIPSDPDLNINFNLGNFAFIAPESGSTQHETGHTLSLAAFGSIFHFVGAIDQNAVQENEKDAWAESIAESHDSRTDVPMWV